MEKITAVDAEIRAKEFIRSKHPRANGVLFTRTSREGDAWMVEGEFWFKCVHFFTVRRSFKLQMKVETGEITSYEEVKQRACNSGHRGPL